MQLFFSPTSPYVRKVLVAALELGIGDRIEKLASAAHPINRDPTIVASNPLGQVPTLIADDGTVVADSRVILSYLNDLAGGALLPADPKARLRAEVDQSLADGITVAALLVRYETAARPAERLWPEWVAGQWDKVRTTLAHFEANPPGGRIDVGTIALACALSYLDFRFPDHGWRNGCPTLAAWYADFEQRPSMAATRLA
ncbi:glutathione S-transferase [Prosthecodimorpha staleyi]|uniref:Glutathione S-transferase n=1 Tax=Prosthecodimorpha staleyi TaxID=2840188 RepID=A0A947D5Q0_9HYPH|nr:glutathione S-transferase [Prosthecodimorpha staleyi]MBT9291538.1 glutathione S-transferase [Prosthecodimorpha staleyi]